MSDELSYFAKRLAIAEQLVAEGQLMISEHHKRIADLEAQGASSVEENQELQTSLRLQVILVGDRDQFQRDWDERNTERDHKHRKPAKWVSDFAPSTTSSDHSRPQGIRTLISKNLQWKKLRRSPRN